MCGVLLLGVMLGGAVESQAKGWGQVAMMATWLAGYLVEMHKDGGDKK